MSRDRESGRRMNPPEAVKLTPEGQAQQNILEYLKGAEMESPRFQAFADYTDLQYSDELLKEARESVSFNRDLIQETIRQRINGVKGYQTEFEIIFGLGEAYGRELKRISSNPSEAQSKLARSLREIKYQGLIKSNNKRSFALLRLPFTRST